MTTRRGWLGSIGLVVGIALCAPAQAGFWDWLTGARAETLLVTGNYTNARLLTELAQFKTGQPVLLISPADAGDDELYFLPSQPEAMALPRAKYVEFVDYLQPKRVVFVGDTEYVPAEYVDQLRGRFPTLVIAGKDWRQNAEALGKALGSSSLAKRYKELLTKVEEAQSRYRYKTEPAPVAEPAAASFVIPAAAPAAVAAPTPAAELAPAASEMVAPIPAPAEAPAPK